MPCKRSWTRKPKRNNGVLRSLLVVGLLLIAFSSAWAQTRTQPPTGVNPRTPIRSGLTSQTPSTCIAQKELYIKTDAVPGQQLYICNASGNGFVLVGDGGGGGGGVTSITAQSPLTGGTISSSGTIGCQTATGGQAGCLSAADWVAFNAKQPAGSYQAAGNYLLDSGSNGLVTRTALNTTAVYAGTSCTNQFPRSLSAAGAATCATVQNADLANTTVQFNGHAVALGSSATLVLASSDFANSGTTNTVLHGNASGNPSWAAVSLTADVTGTLPVASGGTALTSGTSGGVLYFSGSTTLASSAALTANLPVIGGGAGAAPTVGTRSGNTTTFATTSGTLTNGNCVQIDASGNLVDTGSACGSGAGNVSNVGTPTNGQIAQWTTATTIQGITTVGVANGGTGIASGTSGGIPYFSGTTTIASSAALTANLPVIGGGAGTAPSVGTRSGNTTQFVTTTGTLTSGDCVSIDASGNFIAAGTACNTAVTHDILSSTHTDTTAASAVRGDMIAAIGASPKWTRVAHSSATGGYWKWNGTDVVASTMGAAGTGTCTNQVVTATATDAAPTCTTITSAYTSGTFPTTAHNLLSASHSDTTTASAVRGDGLFAVGATPTWQHVAHSGALGGYFKWNGTDIVASTLAAAGVGGCSNSVIIAVNADAIPTCTLISTAMLNLTPLVTISGDMNAAGGGLRLNNTNTVGGSTLRFTEGGGGDWVIRAQAQNDGLVFHDNTANFDYFIMHNEGSAQVARFLNGVSLRATINSSTLPNEFTTVAFFAKTSNPSGFSNPNALYIEGTLLPAANSSAWALIQENSVLVENLDSGYQVGGTAVDSSHTTTAWSGALSSSLRVSSGDGSSTTFFPASFGIEVVPNKAQFYTGITNAMGCCIERDILLRSEAKTAIEIWNKVGSTRDIGILLDPAGTITRGVQFVGGSSFSIGIDFAPAAFGLTPIAFPTSYAGGGNRVLCVDNNGYVFRGATANSCT